MMTLTAYAKVKVKVKVKVKAIGDASPKVNLIYQ